MLSIHVIVDNASNAQLDRALLYLKRTKQQRVQIGAGAQLDRGMQFVERVHIELPNIEIFWRNLEPEDTGIHSKKSAVDVYNTKIAPHRAWMQKHRIVFMPDNESSGDDTQIKRYVAWQVEMAVLLHADNLRGAFCRFATGNISDGSDKPDKKSQYPLLKPIFSAMLPGDYISPNEYSNAPGKSSGGHLARYKLMWETAGKPLPTAIGEAGVCPDYDPGKGFRSVPMTGEAHANQLISEEVWYPGVDRFVYLVGSFGWGKFQLIQDIGNGEVEAETLDTLERYYMKNPPIIVQPPPLPPTYPQLPSAADERWKRVIAAPRGGVVSVRDVPDKGGTVLTKIETVCEISMLGEETHGIWVPVLVPVEGKAPIIGWVTTDVITFLDVPDDVTEPVIELTAKHALFLAEQHESMAASHAFIAESEASIANWNKELAEFYRKIAGEIPTKEGQS